MKRCRNCSQVKRSDEFRSNARCRDGLSSWCSDCHNAATRGYRARIREAEAQARELERIESNERLASRSVNAEPAGSGRPAFEGLAEVLLAREARFCISRRG